MINDSTATITLTSCNFTGNTGGYYGGALSLFWTDIIYLQSNLFQGNSALQVGFRVQELSEKPKLEPQGLDVIVVLVQDISCRGKFETYFRRL